MDWKRGEVASRASHFEQLYCCMAAVRCVASVLLLEREIARVRRLTQIALLQWSLAEQLGAIPGLGGF